MMYEGLLEKKLSNWAEDIRAEHNLPIELKLWNGQCFDLGTEEVPLVTLVVNTPKALPVLLEATLDSLGEAYINELIDIEGSMPDIIRMAFKLADVSKSPKGIIRRAAKLLTRTKEDDKESIQYHYDVSNEFYRLWLDENMLYSCGYFESEGVSLGQAQTAKIDHILQKIQLKPGHRLLDIGCGWGSLVIRAAKHWGAQCVGVTLSEQQYHYAKERVRQEGLEDQVEIRLQDYRELEGEFDRISSVGMFEHVGLVNLPEYFSKIAELLTPDGWAMNHGITSMSTSQDEDPIAGSDFIDKYVFPNGELPHISLVLQIMQESGLEAFDVESLRRHYARTLSLWTEHYEAQSEAVRALVDEKTYRIWRVYLPGCAYAFDIGNVGIYQIVCSKAGRLSEQLPWTREFIYEQKK